MKPLIQAIIAFSILLIVSQLFLDELVFNRNSIAQQQWHRLVTGNFVHSNYPHLLLNLAGLWIAGFLFIDSMNVKTFILSSVILSLFVGLGLYFFNPELIKYYGFSGALYGLFLIGATTVILQKDYVTGFLLYVFIIGKIIWDLFNGGSTSSAELIGIPVAVHAHLYGAIGAIIISLVLFLLKQKNNSKNR
jgi:rhomboid family GlyGly-CTERM serine protease